MHISSVNLFSKIVLGCVITILLGFWNAFKSTFMGYSLCRRFNNSLKIKLLFLFGRAARLAGS